MKFNSYRNHGTGCNAELQGAGVQLHNLYLKLDTEKLKNSCWF